MDLVELKVFCLCSFILLTLSRFLMDLVELKGRLPSRLEDLLAQVSNGPGGVERSIKVMLLI